MLSGKDQLCLDVQGWPYTCQDEKRDVGKIRRWMGRSELGRDGKRSVQGYVRRCGEKSGTYSPKGLRPNN